MRRPAPLPTPADEPEKVEHPAPRARWPRREAAPRHTSAPEHAEQEAAIDAGADAAAADSVTAVIDDGGAGVRPGASPEKPVPAEVRTSDVWRAARARRKALRAEIRRFTQRSRRRRIAWWGSLGAVAALVLGSIIVAYSPLFAVEQITVAGAKTVDPIAVETALAGQKGAPLALVDASAVRSALMAFPIIESYSLETRPPHELLVRIVERTPVGVLRSDAGYTLVDAAGVVLSTTPEPPQGQPMLSISGGTDSAAFHGAGLVVRSLPTDLRARVTQVKASSGDDVTLELDDGKSIVWGSSDDSIQKALVLVALIQKAPDARSFDVSAPTVPVVR